MSDEPTSDPVEETRPAVAQSPTDWASHPEAGAFDTPPPSTRRAYRSRSERRTYRRAARRRKTRARLWMVVAPVVVVIALIVVLLTLLGGPDGGATASTTITTQPQPVYASGLLIVEEGDAVPILVLLHGREAGGLVLGMPGVTLLKTSDGYQTLAEQHKADEDKNMDAVLTDSLGVRAGATVTVQWSDLRKALTSAGLAEVPGESLTSGEDQSQQVADAVLALLQANPTVQKAAWKDLDLKGDSQGFREAVSEMAISVSAGEWAAAVLTGNLVQGPVKYLEPDAKEARALLTGKGVQVSITMQVQNGSGFVGIAEQVVTLMQPLGYTMLPVSNAKGFPDVEQTRIAVAPDVASEGERVRGLLGIGIVTEDQTLGAGTIVVVLGKDYTPPGTAGTAPESTTETGPSASETAPSTTSTPASTTGTTAAGQG